MKSLINKVLATTTVMSLVGAVSTINPVSAASIGYDLKFFDDLGDQVGSGEFSYNPNTSTCIEDGPPFDGSCEFSGFFVDTELTDFSANISGTQWRLRDRTGQTWWDEETNTVKELESSRYGLFLDDQWFFGDSFEGEDLLSMRGSSGGSWIQVLNFNDFLEGTWTAELRDSTSPGGHVIPEPLTILGAGVAIGFGAFFKRKLK